MLTKEISNTVKAIKDKLDTLRDDCKQQLDALVNDEQCDMWDCNDTDNWENMIEIIDSVKALL